MSIVYQLDLFKTSEETRLETMEENIIKTSKSLDKVRKGTFARLNELEQMVKDLKERLEIMEKHICKEGKDEK